MQFPRSDELCNYDIFPKVFRTNEEVTIHIRGLGNGIVFNPTMNLSVTVCALDQGHPNDFPVSSSYRNFDAKCDDDANMVFSCVFPTEQEYFVDLKDNNGNRLVRLSVYAVDQDLTERYPYLGDLHVHSIMSDGRQMPETVCANYRSNGYDFIAITDHRRYYPSLHAIEAFKDIPTELNIVPGEEVHMPPVNGKTTDPHIVNFGGEYSINALVEDCAVWEKGKDYKVRTINESCPDVWTREEYEAEMNKLIEEADIPEGLDKTPIVISGWALEQIRRAGGLAIFPHPNWRDDVYQVPEATTDWFVEHNFFDAFEVLGGENYFEQNGFQTVRYYTDMARGYKYPIVGSTDSHNSYKSNRNALICSTIIFSPKNERRALIQSVKDFYSVAVDTISTEFRIVGEMRYVRYACFLLKNYFPIHHEMCYEEGRLMKVALNGTKEEIEEAKGTLAHIHGRMERLIHKYFAF